MGLHMDVDLNLDAVQGVLDDAAGDAAWLAAEYLLGESIQEVPLEYGDLQDSAATSRDGFTAAVSYDTPYAVRQHEELDYFHKPQQGRQRKAKYLEDPMNREADTMAAIAADHMRKAIQ